MVFGASSSCDLRPAARCWLPALLLADRVPRALLGVFSAPAAPPSLLVPVSVATDPAPVLGGAGSWYWGDWEPAGSPSWSITA